MYLPKEVDLDIHKIMLSRYFVLRDRRPKIYGALDHRPYRSLNTRSTVPGNLRIFKIVYR